ncbi:MAG: formyltransferase family protein [bacterium]
MKAILFIKKDKPTAREVVEYLHTHFRELVVCQGKRGDKFPKDALKGCPDILISYLSPWIIPDNVLNKTRLWNINFHPGPPRYPGIGCFNFAIYNKEMFYGVTAHLMNEKVDDGRIIAVKRFALLESESVYSLSIKSYECMLSLFFEVMNFILKDNKLPECSEAWKRKPYTRKELEELCKIDNDMIKQEIEKRIRATLYPNMPGAYIDMFDFRFEYNPNRKVK